MFETDGNIRDALLDEIVPGMVLRGVQSDGTSSPFSDVVVTRVYQDNDGSRVFDIVRPYAFAHLGGELHSVERVNYMGKNSLDRYKLVMLASGKPYMMEIAY